MSGGAVVIIIDDEIDTGPERTSASKCDGSPSPYDAARAQIDQAEADGSRVRVVATN